MRRKSLWSGVLLLMVSQLAIAAKVETVKCYLQLGNEDTTTHVLYFVNPTTSSCNPSQLEIGPKQVVRQTVECQPMKTRHLKLQSNCVVEMRSVSARYQDAITFSIVDHLRLVGEKNCGVVKISNGIFALKQSYHCA